MSKTHAKRGRYLVATLAGAAAGGLIVALSTRAIPKMMSEMEAKCRRMMAPRLPETTIANGKSEDVCERMIAGMGQAPQQTTCES